MNCTTNMFYKPHNKCVFAKSNHAITSMKRSLDNELGNIETLQLIDIVNKIKKTDSPQVKALKAEYTDMSSGLGALKDINIKMDIDKSVLLSTKPALCSVIIRKDINRHVELDEVP